MNRTALFPCFLVSLFFLLIAEPYPVKAEERYGVLTGTVHDIRTQEPLANVTLRAGNTGRTALTSEEGKFRISLPYGKHQIVFSRVGHLPDTAIVQIADSAQTLDISLTPTVIELPSTKIYERAYDPAQLIIRSAILRKKNILSLLDEYYFTAYTKLLISKFASADSVGPFEYITETQLGGYWEKPDRYKEILIARRQSANLEAEDNLVTIGEILNFNQNRLEIGKYSVVSPTATDALDYYNYYLIDTLDLDGRQLFRLEIEPKSKTTPLFVGTIDIADSSFAIAGVDVGFNEVFEGGIFRNARYTQTLSPFKDSIWMPTEIRFNGDLKLPLPGIPMYRLDYRAALHEYHFNEGLPKGVMNEFALEVDPNVDKIDSATWQAQTTIPLTLEELAGYRRIDSIEALPKPLGRQILMYSLIGMAVVMTQSDFFHYNRVEGSYLGLKEEFHDPSSTIAGKLKAGYALEAERWEQAYELSYQLWKRRRFIVRTEFHNDFRKQPVDMTEDEYNPTMDALFFGNDPFDYYREKGFSVGASMNLIRHTRIGVGYANYDQFSAGKHTDHAIFDSGDPTFRNNPAIADGTDRSLRVQLSFDNRPLIKNKSRIFAITPTIHAKMKLLAEFSSPDLVHSRFDYRRYSASITHKLRIFDLGVLTVNPKAGVVTGHPGAQHAFSSTASFTGEMTDFKTLNDSSFAGTRMFSLYLAHDFGRILFKKLHLPTGKLPIGFQIYGGAFWYEYHLKDSTLAPVKKPGAERPFTEVGFGFNRIPPLGFTTFFSFKLSGHEGVKFSFALGNFMNF